MGIDSIKENDRESILDDFYSDIVAYPSDIKSLIAIHIFNSTTYEYGANGLSGFNYSHLKDNCKWHKVKAKEFVPILMSCINSFIHGMNSKNK